MTNPKRTQEDIKAITIHTDAPGIYGWAVHMRYNDGKAVDFMVDAYDEPDMLQRTSDAIKKQLEGGSW